MTRQLILLAYAAVGATIATCGASMAGGYVEPVAPVSVDIQKSDRFNWTGAYVGGAASFHFASDDEVGLERRPAGAGDNKQDSLGKLDIEGAAPEAVLGYRWQTGDWVVGPSVTFAGGSATANTSISALGVTGELESKVNYLASLKLKSGYLINPETMVYGTIGAAHGNFDYSFTKTGESTQTATYSDNGLSLGFGAEHRLSDKVSMFAEWEIYRFNKNEISFEDAGQNLVTEATPAHQRVRVGVNFNL